VFRLKIEQHLRALMERKNVVALSTRALIFELHNGGSRFASGIKRKFLVTGVVPAFGPKHA
jgi:hypothetical protein